MSVPVLIIAGLIYVARYGRPTRAAALLAVAVFAAGPVWQVARAWVFSGFRPEASFIYLTRAHRATIDTLSARATTTDVLVAEPSDLLWIAPEFPGRLYVGHFFLTVDYKKKNERLQRALGSPDSLAVVLAAAGADWMFVNAGRDRARIARLPGVRAVMESAHGTLFHVRRGGS